MLYSRWLLSDCIQPHLMPVGMRQSLLMRLFRQWLRPHWSLRLLRLPERFSDLAEDGAQTLGFL
ncbi:MAG: hypothetical protein RLZZ153_598 [Pseudomonadota bacterium]|jgi:hypothetical protein